MGILGKDPEEYLPYMGYEVPQTPTSVVQNLEGRCYRAEESARQATADLNEALNALAAMLAIDAIRWANDEGPEGEGWQSHELMGALGSAERLLEKHGRKP